MNFKYKNIKISGILCIIPHNQINFEDEMDNYNFSHKSSLKLKKVMGYNKHRIAQEPTCVSDLCIFGLQYLFNHHLLDKETIDALILVTQTPDHLIPPTSNIIQGKLGLKQDMICMDINQGCTGFLVGLIQSFALLNNEAINKVVLLNGDILSRKVSKKDRNSYPLIGDAASVTIIESTEDGKEIHGNIKMDGSRNEALMIPAGGLRIPSTDETAKLEVDEDNNARSKNDLRMDGKAVFNFVQTEIPPLVDDLLQFTGTAKEDIDYFMFHQPNKFMLQKLAERMKIDYVKMPNNIVENFGNSSGVTIPINIAYNLGTDLKEKSYQICMAGFGVGLTWSAMLLNLGKLDFCNIIEF